MRPLALLVTGVLVCHGQEAGEKGPGGVLDPWQAGKARRWFQGGGELAVGALPEVGLGEGSAWLATQAQAPQRLNNQAPQGPLMPMVGQVPGPPAWLVDYWSPNQGGQEGQGGREGEGGKVGEVVEDTESRQNYWAPEFGFWPTHTVSKFNTSQIQNQYHHKKHKQHHSPSPPQTRIM